jgi:hypothetical protein
VKLSLLQTLREIRGRTSRREPVLGTLLAVFIGLSIFGTLFVPHPRGYTNNGDFWRVMDYVGFCRINTPA